MIGVFIVLIIMYIGIILFAGATFVKISLFAMDKLAVFIASWYYTLIFPSNFHLGMLYIFGMY